VESQFFPALKDSITLRSESFGGYLFDPRAYGSVDLGTAEFRIAALCDGQAFDPGHHFPHSRAGKMDAFPGPGDHLARAAPVPQPLGIGMVHGTAGKAAVCRSAGPLRTRSGHPGARPQCAPFGPLGYNLCCNLTCPHCLTGSGRSAPDEMNRAENWRSSMNFTICGSFRSPCAGVNPGQPRFV